MLENIRERYRKWSKEADDRNVKTWQKHPKLNKWITFLWVGSMIGGATVVIILSLSGYITQEISASITVVAIVCSVVIYGCATWASMYLTKIARKAFPKSS